jgi:glycerol-3-phosphate acyltransferase PlsY
MLIGRLFIAAALGYFVGAFPTGVLVTRLLGKPDPRLSFSGHTGGLNIYRLAGITWGVFTMLADASKGVLASWLALKLTEVRWAIPAAGICAVAGHCWSSYVGFAGGMGLSTLGGLLVWQQPVVLPMAGVLWGLGYLVLRSSPRAVMVMALLMIPVFWLLRALHDASPEATALGIGGVVVIFVRHLTQLSHYDGRTPLA